MKSKPIKTLKEIKEAITGLSHDKFSVFREWFEKFYSKYQDVQYHQYVVRKINKGLKQLSQGRGIEHQEVRKSLRKWISK